MVGDKAAHTIRHRLAEPLEIITAGVDLPCTTAPRSRRVPVDGECSQLLVAQQLLEMGNRAGEALLERRAWRPCH
jgi:hypothetical protein